MAQRTSRLGAWENDAIIASITWNDANNNVASATIVNNHPTKTIRFDVWLASDPNGGIFRVVPPLTTQTYNVPGGVKYSDVELPEGDPRQGNFGYTASVF